MSVLRGIRGKGLGYNVMSDVVDKLEHWRKRAEEARTTANGMSDPDAKRVMLAVVASYEEVVKRAESRVWSGKP